MRESLQQQVPILMQTLCIFVMNRKHKMLFENRVKFLESNAQDE